MQILIQGCLGCCAYIFMLQRLFECGLILVGEGGLVDCATEFGHLGYNFISSHFHDQDKQSLLPGVQGITDIFDELVIDAQVGDFAEQSTHQGAEETPENGGQEEQTDQ